MARRKQTAGFKTKSKKNKKSKKVKSKKSAKEEREKETKKIELGLKDICSALNGLEVCASVPKEEKSASSGLPVTGELTQKSRKTARRERHRKERICRKTESNISRLFQKLTCSSESSSSTTSCVHKTPGTRKVMSCEVY